MLIVVSGALIKFVDYQREHEVAAPTPLEGIRELTKKYPALENALFDEANELRKFNAVYVDKQKASPQRLNEAVNDDARVEIITAIAGG